MTHKFEKNCVNFMKKRFYNKVLWLHNLSKKYMISMRVEMSPNQSIFVSMWLCLIDLTIIYNKWFKIDYELMWSKMSVSSMDIFILWPTDIMISLIRSTHHQSMVKLSNIRMMHGNRLEWHHKRARLTSIMFRICFNRKGNLNLFQNKWTDNIEK